MADLTLEAGLLRHVINIQQQIQTRDNFGGVEVSWVDKFPKTYARYEPLSGKELFANGQMQSQVTTRFTIRYRPGVDTSQRIVFRNRIYNIHAVVEDNVSGMEWITLHCSEGLNNGA